MKENFHQGNKHGGVVTTWLIHFEELKRGQKGAKAVVHKNALSSPFWNKRVKICIVRQKMNTKHSIYHEHSRTFVPFRRSLKFAVYFLSMFFRTFMKYFNAIDFIFCVLNLFFRIQTIELIDIKNKVRELVANLKSGFIRDLMDIE